MPQQGSFRSALQQLVFELSVAHDREVAALQAEVSRLHNGCQTPPRHNGCQTPPQPKRSELGATVIPSWPSEQLAITPPMSPDIRPPRYEALLATPKDASFSARGPRHALPPTQPKLSDPCDLDEDNFSISSNPVHALDPGVVSLTSEDIHPMHQYPKQLLSELPEDYIEHLQEQFDRLDTEGQDRISVDACLEMIQTCGDVTLEREELIAALERIAADRMLEEELTSPKLQTRSTNVVHKEASNTSSDPDQHWLTFEDFAYLMASGQLDDGEVEHTTSKSFDVLGGLRQALLAFDNRQMSLAEAADRARKKHQRLVVFLDCIPAPVIILNSLTMGLRQDIDPDAIIWKVLDFVFLSFYISEAAIKLWVFRPRVYCCGPGWSWNWFDCTCISISLIDIFLEYLMPLITKGEEVPFVGELMLMKMLRLARLARLVKTLRYPYFNELKALVFGVVAGGRVILWAMVLLFVCIFFFGAIMNNLVGDTHQEFDSVPASMFTVFRCFTDGCEAYDGTPLTERLRIQYGAPFILPYVLAFMFITVGVFNLIMATFIENVVSTNASRKQEELSLHTEGARLSLEEAFIRLITTGVYKKSLISERLQREVEKRWVHDVESAFRMLPLDLQVSKIIFRKWLEDRDFIHVLRAADIDISNTNYLFDVLDADMSGELSLKELIDGLMRLRGPITKCDMIGVRMQVRYTTLMSQDMQQMIQDMHRHMALASAETKKKQRKTQRHDTGLGSETDVSLGISGRSDTKSIRRKTNSAGDFSP